MKMKKDKSIKKIQISISLPKALVAQIDKMAKAENRNRSNFVAKTFADMVRANVEREKCFPIEKHPLIPGIPPVKAFSGEVFNG